MKYNKKAQSYTNVILLIIIVLSITTLMIGFKDFGRDLLTSSNARLNNESKLYVTNDLHGMNLSIQSGQDTTQAPYLLANETQSNKDYSLEFQYAKEKSEGFWSTVFDIYKVPSQIIVLFGIASFIPVWLQTIISTLMWTIVTVALYYIVRGIIK